MAPNIDPQQLRRAIRDADDLIADLYRRLRNKVASGRFDPVRMAAYNEVVAGFESDPTLQELALACRTLDESRLTDLYN